MWQDRGTVSYSEFVGSWEKFASNRGNELCFKKQQYLPFNHMQSESQCHAPFLPVQAWTELFRGLFKIRISFGWWACFNTCHKMYIFQRSCFHNFRSKCKVRQEGFYRLWYRQGFPYAANCPLHRSTVKWRGGDCETINNSDTSQAAWKRWGTPVPLPYH